MAGHEANQKIIEFIKGIQAEIGKAKFELSEQSSRIDEMFEAVKAFAIEDVKARSGYRRQDRPRCSA